MSQPKCTKYDLNAKLMASLWTGFIAAGAFFLFGIGLLGVCKKMKSGENWGYLVLFSLCAGIVAFGVAILIMAPWETTDKQCCPIVPPAPKQVQVAHF